MAKSYNHFVCQTCGSSFPKWSGKCESCGAWNTLIEEAIESAPPKGLGATKKRKTGKALNFVPLKGKKKILPRYLSKIGEFDRVVGGGLVPGSATLLGGDPGIGKSTLLLQIVCKLAKESKVAYISGEEAIDQVRLRAERLGVADVDCDLASATSVRNIVSSLEEVKPNVLVIDSIQTMYVDTIDSAPGTVAQVRTSAQEIIRACKKLDISVILVGHVTKEGTIAGPRVLEHMVDTVLYLEGERGHQFRILRSVKNRFGPTDEIGVFEMLEEGLMEVHNPSALFLADRHGDTSGAAVFAGLEGTRPVLVEIQALVAPSSYGTPRRAVIGWDSSRLAMVLAVLESRCGINFANNDVYLNVAGGFRVSEPAADLAVAAALISALSGTPVPNEAVVFGEIGLSGEIRRVSQPEIRLKEASKLGFNQAILPKIEKKKGQIKQTKNIRRSEIKRLKDILPLFEIKESG